MVLFELVKRITGRTKEVDLKVSGIERTILKLRDDNPEVNKVEVYKHRLEFLYKDNY